MLRRKNLFCALPAQLCMARRLLNGWRFLPARACADGEPQRPDRRRRRHPRLGPRRAAGRPADDHAARRAAGADHAGCRQGVDTQDFVAELGEINVTAHVAQNLSGRRSAIDGETTRHPGYEVSLRIRKRIEEAFG